MMPSGFKNMNADKIIQCILAVMLKLEKAFNSTIEALQDKLDRGGYIGTAQDLDDEIQNLKNPDAVLKSVTPTITGLNISAPIDSYEWRINQVVFDNTPALAKTLNAATDGFYRKDALLGTNTNSFLIFEGTEGDESVAAPTVFPAGTILLGIIDVFGDSVIDFVIDDTSANYLDGNGGATDYLEVNGPGATLIVFNATSLTGFTILNENIQFGKDYYLRNLTGVPLILKSATGTNNIRFYFPEGDLIVPLQNTIHLKYVPNNEFGGLGYFTLVGINYEPALQHKANISGQVFTGNISAPNLSGVNTGNETTSSIQNKRPLKTIDEESLEGNGNIITENSPTTNIPTNYTSLNNTIKDNFEGIDTRLGELQTLDLYTPDLSIYIDEDAKEIRSNIGNSKQKYFYTSGPKVFTLVNEPTLINYITIRGAILDNEFTDYYIDVVNKQITILTDIPEDSSVLINYDFIITP